MADALEATPRSQPFERLAELTAISAPALVVASRDESDPGHPLHVGARYAQTIPHARLAVIPRAGHMPMWENAEAFNRVVTAFLRALATAPRESTPPESFPGG